MLRSELIRETSLRTGYTQIVCGEILRELFDIMSDELEAHGSIHIPNFGVFDVYDKRATSKKMPDTGEIIAIDAKKYPRFRPADTLKEKVNS